MEVSNVASFQAKLKEQLRQFFRFMHEHLQEIEGKKINEINEMFQTAFNAKVDITEVKTILSVGIKH